MNDVNSERRARQAGTLGLALLLIAVSAGFAYVAHLTAATSQRLGDAGPSVLPLIVLSVLAAISGIGTLRFWLRGDSETV